MLTFLRKVRKSLIDSGGARKYFLYAIGEVALVVIGILIALQINNWNQSQKQKALEINLLHELKGNLTSDLSDIRYNIKEDKETLFSNQIVLYQIENNLPFNDTMSIHYGKLQRNSTFIENRAAYENLKTIGFNLISNDSLRSKITHLYSARYDYIDEVNLNTSNRFIWDHLSPILIKNLRSTEVLQNAVPLNSAKLSENTSFMEALRWHIAIKEFIINLYKDIELEIVLILELINDELGNNQH